MAQEATIIGRTLAGKFRVTGVIGEGGMATVYRAQQDAEPKEVAIKVMNPELAKDSRFVRRFRREAKAAAMLKHPNTVSILEFGVDEGFVFLAMECVEGSDLALLLHRERRVSEARAATIVTQVCQALGAAHDLSIVHRDLKPDNIMIVRRGDVDVVKVLDFGIAKILDEDAEGKVPFDPRAEPGDNTGVKSLLTRVGTIVGTPAYMAPEQGRAEPVDGRTDVYACGVLLYELITGRVPFSGETPMQVVMRHVNEPPQPPSHFLPVHPALEAVIMRSLSKWPAERQQSAKELAGALAAILPELAVEKRQVESTGTPKVVIGDARPAQTVPRPPPAPAPPAAPKPAPAAEPRLPHKQPTEESTLVIDPTAPKAPAPPAPPPQRPAIAAGAPAVPKVAPAPATNAAPSFPTLNIDVPEDILVGIAPKPLPAAGNPPPPPPDEPDSDSDDVRTLVADPSATAAPAPAAPHAPDSTDDDPRTVVAPPRAASIPDLSQPISFGGALPGAETPSKAAKEALPPALAPAPRPAAGVPARAVEPASAAPTRPTAMKVPPAARPPQAGSAAPRGQVSVLADPAVAKSSTLVSALPDESPSVAMSSAPKPPGTTPLGALKGTAKLDPVEVSIDVAAATMVPNTKPSPVASSFELAKTQRVDAAAVEAEAAAASARARLGIEESPKNPTPAPVDGPGIIPAPIEASASLAAAPVTPQVEPLGAPSVVVWEPKRRKLSGPVAMLLGVLIGALLFGLALLVAKSSH